MYLPQQSLKQLSLHDSISHVLKTPNKIHYSNNFQGWQQIQQHPQQSPERKYFQSNQKTTFKVKNLKIKLNPQNKLNSQFISKYNHLQNKQNQHHKSFNLKMVQILDEQTLSPNSRKIITPNKYPYQNQQHFKTNPNQQKYFQTPKSTYRTRQVSLRKLSATQGINKISFSQKRNKFFNDETTHEQSINQQDNSFKIPLSAIVYPMLKSNAKRPLRRIQRFHSFVARTVRK